MFYIPKAHKSFLGFKNRFLVGVGDCSPCPRLLRLCVECESLVSRALGVFLVNVEEVFLESRGIEAI